jgi:hypothetical protein
MKGFKSSRSKVTAVVAVAAHEIPTEQGIWGEEGRAVLQQFAADFEDGGREAALLRNTEKDASRPEFFTQDAVLFIKVLDHFLRLPVHPSRDASCGVWLAVSSYESCTISERV